MPVRAKWGCSPIRARHIWLIFIRKKRPVYKQHRTLCFYRLQVLVKIITLDFPQEEAAFRLPLEGKAKGRYAICVRDGTVTLLSQ